MASQLVEYMKIHLISIEQDIQSVVEQMEGLDMNSKDYRDLDFEYNYLEGQAMITRHYLQMSGADDTIDTQTKETV